MFHVEQLRRIFRNIRGRRFKYSPLIRVNIYKSRILSNFDYFSSISSLLIAPVLKSNAYGHDLVKVAKMFEERSNIPFIVIDNYYEAIVLENEQISKELLVIGFTQTENLLKSTNKKTAFTIGSIGQLKELSSNLNEKLRIHLKIDTGMNRQGIGLEELSAGISLIQANSHIVLEGICSHLSSPQNAEILEIQKNRWAQAVETVKKQALDIKYFHVLATSGIAYNKHFYSNVARIGLGLFGFDLSHAHTKHIQPTLSVVSHIASVKKVSAGEYIGYDGTYRAQKEMHIAILPVGYYEGLDRRLSNLGMVKIKNTYCKIIGRISMNISTVDMGNDLAISENDTANIISSEREDANSVESIAKMLDCTPYEVLVKIPNQLRREVVS